MKTFVNVNDKLIGEYDVDEKIIENGDLSELYNVICALCPDNKWNDLECRTIEYTGEYYVLYMTAS